MMLKMKYVQTVMIYIITYIQYLEGKYNYNEKMLTKLKPTKIFVNENFKSIETLWENSSETKNIELFVQNNGNNLYTALKCEYAHTMVGFLESFHTLYTNELLKTPIDKDNNNLESMSALWKAFESESTAKTQLNTYLVLKLSDNFISLRPFFTQMLFNLFRILDMDQERKTNDISLLKSMLAIYLYYVYHSDNLSNIVYEEDDTVSETASENDEIISEDKSKKPDDPDEDTSGKDDLKNDSLSKDGQDNLKEDGSNGDSSDDEMLSRASSFNENRVNYEKTMKNIIILNNSIKHMVGLINSFRFRKCEINNPNEYTDRVQSMLKDKTFNDYLFNDIINPLAMKLVDLYDLPSVLYTEQYFDDNNLYKPEVLMMKSLLDNYNLFIGNVKVFKNNEQVSLMDLYTNIEDPYNINEIFSFQKLLFDLINDIFYRRIHKLITENDISNLDDLRVNFNFYTSIIIPKVCLKDACKNVIEMKLLLDNAFKQHSKDHNSNVFTTLLENYKSMFSSNFIYPDSVDHSSDPTLEMLIQEIKNLKYFNAISQVIKLLSYESYNNNDYHTIKISDFEKKYSELDKEKQKFLENMNELRYALYAFSIFSQNNKEQLDNVTRNTSIDIPEKFKTNTFGIIFAYALIYIVKTYNDLSDGQEFKNILLPLLIHLEYINQIYLKMEEFDFQSLYQTLLVTINMIENRLLVEYKWVPYNNFIYTYRVLKNKNKPDLTELYNDLQEIALKSLNNYSYEDSIILLSNEFNTYVHKPILDRNDESIRFYWNGDLHYSHEILKDISRGVIYFNDLISFQIFTIKFFVANILVGFQWFLILSKDNHEDYVSKTETMQNNVKEFDTLDFPSSVEYILTDTVQAILKTISSKSEVLNENELINTIRLINEDLEALDVNHSNRSYSSINDIVNSLNIDLELCSHFLNHMKDTKTKNDTISQDLSLSLVENKITDEIDNDIRNFDDILG